MPRYAELHTVFQFRLPVRLHQWLMDYAQRTGQPASQIIKDYLESLKVQEIRPKDKKREAGQWECSARRAQELREPSGDSGEAGMRPDRRENDCSKKPEARQNKSLCEAHG